MRKAIVRDSDGRVVNVIEVVGAYDPGPRYSLLDAGTGGPRDTWDGAKFVRPEPDIETLREDLYGAAHAEFVKRAIALLGVKVRGSTPEEALSFAAIDEVHRGGPNAGPLSMLRGKLNILKDTIEAAVVAPALNAIDVTEDGNWT